MWHINKFYSVKRIKSDFFKIKDKLYSFVFERMTFKNSSDDMFTIFLNKEHDSGNASFGSGSLFGQHAAAVNVSRPTNSLTITIFIKGEQSDLHFNQQRVVDLNNAVNESIWQISRQEFIEKSDYLVEGETETLTFICVFGPVAEIINCMISSASRHLNDMKDKEISISEAKKLANLGSYESISADLTKLLDGESFSDVILKCQDMSYKAHKNILLARSPVFAAMFLHDMIENKENVVNIKDMNAEILSDFLKYIYSGKLPTLSEETAPLLYEAGDRYCIEMLKKDSASYMKSILSFDNVCDFLVLSDACSDEEFKKELVNFIIKEADHIFKQEFWLKFQKEQPALAVDVYYAYNNAPI